jgi:hypothetical protein
MCGRDEDLHDAAIALDEAEEAGRQAAISGLPMTANPYKSFGHCSTEHYRWDVGHVEGSKQIAALRRNAVDKCNTTGSGRAKGVKQ